MVRRVFSDRLVKAGGALFLASMVTNGFNYFFQVTMGRLLLPADYGLMNSMLAMFVVMSVPLATILMVVSRQTAEYKAKGDFAGIRSLFRQAYKKLFLAGFVGLVVFFGVSAYIKDYVHAPSITPVLFLGLSIFVSCAPCINFAVLQGIQDFKWLNAGVGLAGPLKFTFCVAAVIAGLGVSGVMGGLVLASLTMWAVTLIPLRRDTGSDKGRSVHADITFSNVLPVLSANLAFAVMTQADMVLVKHLFTSQEAGMYASASVLGKAVLYLPGALVLAMFPMVAESNALRSGSGHLLKKAFLICLLLSGSGALLLLAFPSLIMKTLFGMPYGGAVGVLRYFGVAMLPMALLFIMVNYFIARGKKVFSYIMAFGALFEITSILLFHGSLMAVIFNLLATGAIMVFLGAMLLYLEYRMGKKACGLAHVGIVSTVSIKAGE